LRDYVLHLRTATNRFCLRRRPDSPEPGSINARTGKPYLGAGYQPSTINHRLSVTEGFYAFQQHTRREPVFAALWPNRPRHAHHLPAEACNASFPVGFARVNLYP